MSGLGFGGGVEEGGTSGIPGTLVTHSLVASSCFLSHECEGATLRAVGTWHHRIVGLDGLFFICLHQPSYSQIPSPWPEES